MQTTRKACSHSMSRARKKSFCYNYYYLELLSLLAVVAVVGFVVVYFQISQQFKGAFLILVISYQFERIHICHQM